MSILIQYAEEVLTPTFEQIKFMKSKIKSIKNVLTHNSPINPKEIHLGGSMGKNTMLKHKLDADLVFLYNRSEEVANNWNVLANIVYETLKSNFPDSEVEEAGNLAIHIKTEYKNMEVNFDIVPGFFVNSPKIMEQHIKDKLYIPNTTIWHTRYIERYKNLLYFPQVIRLLKDWRIEHSIPLKSLHLELIVADVYDNAIDDIGSIKGIDNVLMLCYEDIIDTLDGYPVFPSNWKYCNEDNYEDQYDEPVLIDPANPNDNLLTDLTKKKIKNIRIKTEITMENLKHRYYAEIFNKRGLTDYFD
jgi:tRNA nucleotidyltransferase (CCA-adding enzyme)